MKLTVIKNKPTN